jgi:ABC-type phosphate/phosphonate transport system substrate-binding protein
MSAGTILVGAVAYHPRVVTVWEGFRPWFAARGLDVDFVLYSNYERQVRDFLDGRIDLAWNTNTAYVHAEHALRGRARVLGMRDVDADFATVLVGRRGDGALEGGLGALRGRRVALGSRDSGHAAILPLHFLAEEGVDAERDCELVRFDTDLGKHGDTGDSELHVARAVAGGEADVGALGDAVLAALRDQGYPPAGGLEVVWRSPPYYHCNFTARPDLPDDVAQRWLDALLAMDFNDPRMRPAMELEGVKRWLPGDKDGYAALTGAMRAQGLLG